MHGKYLAAVAVGIILGVVGTAVVVRQPPAQAQERKAAWEYRVVLAFTDAVEPERLEKGMNDQFSRLAADGWEYVGPAAEASRSNNQWQYTGARGAYLVFKRQKQ
jgi:Domain of unknown function (DUF4177)